MDILPINKTSATSKLTSSGSATKNEIKQLQAKYKMLKQQLADMRYIKIFKEQTAALCNKIAQFK
jgi:hypothetical protein